MPRSAKTIPAHLLLEKQVQARVIALFRRVGCRVYLPAPWTKPGSPSATPGIADLYVVHPARGAWWMEVKGPNGRQSPAQKEFQRVNEQVGMRYVIGGVQEAMDLLVTLRLLAPSPASAGAA